MTDPHLLIFGLGYTGAAVAHAAVAAGFAVTATSRKPAIKSQIQGVAVVPFDAAIAAVATATHLLSTAPPLSNGTDGARLDPVLAVYSDAIGAAARLGWVGYLSTTGVYGDHSGGWVDETTPPMPGQDRSRRRLAIEQEWAALSVRTAVDLFRVAGIYGPGRSVLDELRAGRGRRIIRPGHPFCRLHRDDIANAVLAAMRQSPTPGVRVFNLSDDEPADAASVVEEAARLLGLPPPPEMSFEQATLEMSAMARSFWQESRRVSSVQTQATLGLRWRYPSYREGLRAILAAEQDDHAA